MVVAAITYEVMKSRRVEHFIIYLPKPKTFGFQILTRKDFQLPNLAAGNVATKKQIFNIIKCDMKMLMK